MSKGLKVAIAFNLIATLIIGAVAYSVGGGSTGPPLPPDTPTRLLLVRIDPKPDSHRPVRSDIPMHHGEIPPEYRVPDLTPSPWIFLPDGTIQFRDADH
jgi:hypothetical protein